MQARAALCIVCLLPVVALGSAARQMGSTFVLDHRRAGATAAANALPQLFEVIFSSTPPNACTRPPAVDYFSTTTPTIYVWLYVSGARAGSILEVDFAPPGGPAGSESAKPYPMDGDYCHQAPVPLADYSDRNRIGDWIFRILVDGTQIGSAATVVIGPNQPRIDSVEDYGNGQVSDLSPGSLAIVHGVNLAAATDTTKGVPLPTSLGGATVTMNGITAPVFHAESAALYVQVPAGIRADSAAVRVVNNAGVSNRYRMPLNTVSPALLADDGQPSQAQVFRLNADGSTARVGPGLPLQRGDTAVLVTGGLGPTLDPPPDGSGGADDSACVFSPQVSMGGVSVPVMGCFLGDFPGVYWVYVQAPPEVPSGTAVPVLLTVNGIESNQLTLPILGPGPSFPAITVTAVEHPAWNGVDRNDKIYNPTSLVAITATNLHFNAPTYMQCSDSSGFQGAAPAAKVTDTYAMVTAPFYVDARTNDYGSGLVSCVLVQKVADQTLTSQAFQITIQLPPTPRGNPGEMTLALVQAASQGARSIQSALTLKQQAQGGKGFSAADTPTEMDSLVTAYAPYLDALRKVSSGSQQSVTLGTGANGKPMLITRDALARTDRWIAAIATEVTASAVNNEDFQPPPPRDVHTNGATRSRAIGSRSSPGSTLLGLGRVCFRGALESIGGLFTGDGPSDLLGACTALTQVPQAFATAVVQTAESTAEDLTRVAGIAAVAAIPLGPEAAEAAAVLTRMATVATNIQTAATAAEYGVAIISPDTPDRTEILQRDAQALAGAGANAATGGLLNALKNGIQDLYGDKGLQAYDLGTSLVDLGNQVKAETDKLAQMAAETLAPVVTPNADGSNSLTPDLPTGGINFIDGKILGSNNAPLQDGYVELGDGSRMTTPYGVAVLNPDGSYSLPVPSNEVGITIPVSVPIQVDAPDPSGNNNYISYSGQNLINVGQSQTLPTQSLPSSPSSGGGSSGGGTCLYACRAD
jgi:uncharacterized protein (TIGR03437 family)